MYTFPAQLKTFAIIGQVQPNPPPTPTSIISTEDVLVFSFIFFICSLCGYVVFNNKNKDNKDWTKFQLFNAMLNSALSGLGTGFLLKDRLTGSPITLMGICITLGLAGASGFSILLKMIEGGNFGIKLFGKEFGNFKLKPEDDSGTDYATKTVTKLDMTSPDLPQIQENKEET